MMDRLKIEKDRVQMEVAKEAAIKAGRVIIGTKKEKEIASKNFFPHIIQTIIICVSIVILCIFAYTHHQKYLENYETAKQEIIDERYKRLVELYDNAYEKEKNKTDTDISVIIVDELLYNNSVGNNWEINHYINNNSFDGMISTFHASIGEKVSIETIAKERDSVPDIGKENYAFTITKEHMHSNFSIEQNVIVTENRGKHSGNTAEWKTTYMCSPVKHLLEKPDKSSITVSESDVKNRMKEEGTL